jgi:hypothetical protein
MYTRLIPAGGDVVISVRDVEARVRRLEELSRGLSKELTMWKGGDDPLLYLERRSYLNAMQDALAGVEEARVVLARAAQRVARGGSGPPDARAG